MEFPTEIKHLESKEAKEYRGERSEDTLRIERILWVRVVSDSVGGPPAEDVVVPEYDVVDVTGRSSGAVPEGGPIRQSPSPDISAEMEISSF